MDITVCDFCGTQVNNKNQTFLVSVLSRSVDAEVLRGDACATCIGKIRVALEPVSERYREMIEESK